MGAVVRERIKGSGDWYIFINHRGLRGSKRIGPNKNKALAAADLINIRLALSDVGLDLSRWGKKAPPLLKHEQIARLKTRLAKIGKRANAEEIPLWALKIVEHQAMWEGVIARRKGEEHTEPSREKILEAAVELAETYRTQKRYGRSLAERKRVIDLMRRINEIPAKPETKPVSQKPAEENQHGIDDSNPGKTSPNQTGQKVTIPSSKAKTRSSKEEIKPRPIKEHILYEKTRKRKEYKEALKKRYSPRMGYRWK